MTQLKAEGIKKVESLVFEAFLKLKFRKILKTSTDTTISYGWFCAFNRFGSPCYWFKLQEHEDDWNLADDKFCALLEGQKIGQYNSDAMTLHKIKFDPQTNKFTINHLRNKTWLPDQDIEPYLRKLSKKRDERNIVEYDNTAEKHELDRYHLATEELLSPNLRPELSTISIQRRLINCIISPILGCQPADLDALVLSPNGKLSYLEFKRKYPAPGDQYFGLDEAPHATLLRTFNSFNIGMLHLILATPYRDKDSSPIKTLKESNKDPKKASKWVWLCAVLNSQNFSIPTMKTTGKNSGFLKTKRKQHIIPWELFHLLHDNLKLGGAGEKALLSFLEHGMPSVVTPVRYKDLNERVIS